MTGDEVGTRPQPPLVLFDRDAYLYSFLSVGALQSWFEPLMEEEMARCFDSLGRGVVVQPVGPTWQARIATAENDEESLRVLALAFLQRFEPDKLNMAELPAQSMVGALASLRRYAIA